MLDRSIPFYNTIMRCDGYDRQRVALPAGYRIAAYRPGNEYDWARLECAVGDFDSADEAAAYFRDKYLTGGDREDILFLVDGAGAVVGSCIAWTDRRGDEPVNSLHWLVVDEAHQGRGCGRALCAAVMNRFYLRNRQPIYIHTQPWSWKAILLYASLGFRLQKTDTFGAYVNQYEDALNTLRGVLTEEQVQALAARLE
ncbi:MAG: GNAT family N-acetyltransferase [Clostridia bacterium]|nr:GNAT family N-acetyltransferase [Clostridia bacterium]